MATQVGDGVRLDRNDDDVLKGLAETAGLLRKIGQKRSPNAEDREVSERLVAEITKLNDTLSQRAQATKERYTTTDADRDIKVDGRAVRTLDRLHQLNTRDPDVVDFQEFCDHLYIMKESLGIDPRKTEYFRDGLDRLPMARKAMATTDSSAPNWMPTEFSSDLKRKIRLSEKVAALHPTVEMPTPIYKLPIEGADAEAYLISENTGANDPGTPNTWVTVGLTNPALANLTLTAVKLGSRIVFSTELSEDTIIPILPYVRDKIALCMANAREEAVISGDTSGTHMDSNVTASNDRRKAWDGYRKHCPSGNKFALGTAQAPDVADIRKARTSMGKYGITPGDVVMITGPLGYGRMLALKDGSNPSPILTLEKYGPQAVILTGELARVDGVPIIVSEFVPENLNNVGVYDGATFTNRTLIMLVNKSAFLHGNYRSATLKSRESIETDQTVLVTLERRTFNNWWGGQATQTLGAQPVVSILYNA